MRQHKDWDVVVVGGINSVVIGAGSEGDLLVGRDGEFFLPR